MFDVVLVGGYCGEHGAFTAHKVVQLPFVPHAKLELISGDDEIGVVSDVQWCFEKSCFYATLMDQIDRGKMDYNEHVNEFRRLGWEIIDEDRAE